MNKSIVSVKEFVNKYNIPKEISARFLPLDLDVFVISEEEFQRLRDSRKRRNSDVMESPSRAKKPGIGGYDHSAFPEDISAALNSHQSSLQCSNTVDFSTVDTSFELLESSFLLCHENGAPGASDVAILQSSEFHPINSELSSPPQSSQRPE
ncbi:LAME_0E01266g1_1 [Lachancea meyersii CBS 8951]|uniref:LAME_0E01266g1_1 n=1 Tax=Lachancea meyersii CBS 8951 TaxID=1266667 RepID=A0A1G4JF05_9SACH|nr:LAME_0E01266g1_1 [Lachancea meyersii CBS 8951]